MLITMSITEDSGRLSEASVELDKLNSYQFTSITKSFSEAFKDRGAITD